MLDDRMTASMSAVDHAQRMVAANVINALMYCPEWLVLAEHERELFKVQARAMSKGFVNMAMDRLRSSVLSRESAETETTQKPVA